jgi:nucleoid-associated protein YgaU
MAINAGSIVNGLSHTTNKLRITQFDANSSGIGDTSLFSNIINNAGGSSKIFEVQINPEKYQRHYKTTYNQPAAQGTDASQVTQTFNRIEAETLTITFILDGTGVIPASISDAANFAISAGVGALNSVAQAAGLSGITDTGYVTRRINDLKKVAYDFDNSAHEPPIVVVTWGDVPPFKGKIEDLQITFTLFHPNGAPLRAEIQLQLKEHGGSITRSSNGVGSAITGAALNIGGALLSSPDLTHRRIVKATDTLPLLCEEIYKDASFYWQVAKANNLTHFRELEVGSELFFPPIER